MTSVPQSSLWEVNADNVLIVLCLLNQKTPHPGKVWSLVSQGADWGHLTRFSGYSIVTILVDINATI